MLTLNLSLANPFSKNLFRNLILFHRPVGKNRSIELQVAVTDGHLISLELQTSMSGYDHAGPWISLSVLGLWVAISLPDRRHWDYLVDNWQE